jgi:hypothetical protein
MIETIPQLFVGGITGAFLAGGLILLARQVANSRYNIDTSKQSAFKASSRNLKALALQSTRSPKRRPIQSLPPTKGLS